MLDCYLLLPPPLRIGGRLRFVGSLWFWVLLSYNESLIVYPPAVVCLPCVSFLLA